MMHSSVNIYIYIWESIHLCKMEMMKVWRSDYCFPNWERENPIAICNSEPFSQGACRYAYQARYTKFHNSRSHGERAIIKRLKNCTIWKREDWDEEIKLAKKAKEFVNKWNATHSVEKRYIIHVPEVIRTINTGRGFKSGEWVTLEPYIEGNYEKWNSNSGWNKEEKLSVMPSVIGPTTTQGGPCCCVMHRG